MSLEHFDYSQIFYLVSGFDIDDSTVQSGLLTAYPYITWVSGSNFSRANLYNFNGYWTRTQLSGLHALLSGVYALMPSGAGYDYEELGPPIS